MNPSLPPASIIINTYNRGAWLDDALRGLAGLDYPEFEVIVVNGPSTDNSAEVIARWAGRIKALTCDVANLAISRNVGIAAADGAIIAFIDDDAVPHPQWLRRLALGFRDAEVGAMGGFTVETSGTRWQVRKTVCDRFGTAHNVTDFFDERPLNRPGTPFYPSLLGTNSAFRAEALRAIGGFDHAFAYLLDETDVCLRLVDAGWHVRYDPQALVWHQFARSHIRDGERVARTVYPSSVSRAYFAVRHGGAADLAMAGERIDAYRQEILASNAWLERHGQITAEHRHSLDQDVLHGIEQGRRLAMTSGAKPGGDLTAIVPQVPTPFLRFEPSDGRRIVLVSQGWPPENDTGIARWTALVARGLVARGHKVHVLTRAAEGMPETVRFDDGLWLHRLTPADPPPGDSRYEATHAGTAPVPDPECLDAVAAETIAARHGIPRAMASWPARVWREVQFLKSFGVELVSFPIWDLEGIALLDDPDLVPVVSLHTTYAMAAPHRPDWIERPLLAARHVAPMIAAETAVLTRAPLCLANSQAIVGEVLHHHGVDLAQRAVVVPHGTPDPLTTRAAAASAKVAEALDHAPLDVLFVGRFEPRKGFDIALRVARAVLAMPNVTMTFVGGALDDAALAQIAAQNAGAILDHPRIRFAGTLDRDLLDDAYVAADVVLMPSRFESFGLVAIEAMAAGRPVLALDGGGLGEVARPDCGARAFADAPDVADRIAAEIVWLDADREELTLRMRQARAGWATHYSADAMVRGIEAFVERALGDAEKRARVAAGIVQIGPPPIAPGPVAPPPSPRRRAAGEPR